MLYLKLCDQIPKIIIKSFVDEVRIFLKYRSWSIKEQLLLGIISKPVVAFEYGGYIDLLHYLI